MTNMKWKVLVSAPYAMPVIERFKNDLRAAGCEVVVAPVNERLEEDQLLELLPGMDGIICGDDRISERVLAATPKLKVISKWGTGIDSIDSAAAARHGVAVCNTLNAFSEPVADSVMGYVLVFARRLAEMNDAMHGGRWFKPQLVALRERTMGVIGVGNCGKAVVRRAVSFGMRVLGCDPIPIPGTFASQTGIVMTGLEQLLREADFVTLHTTLNPTSHHLINASSLEFMKPTGVLINTSRGPVVDEEALVVALQSGRIAGAALDVFEDEPLPADSRLRQFSNCWLAPHSANSSIEAADRVHQSTINNLLRELRARG